MGMVWVARLADDAQVAKIMADPDSAYDFVNPEEDFDDLAIVDLDKDWHGVHHLLTGSAEPIDNPLSLIVGDFEEVGEDNGYGPAWFVPSDRLRAFHEALSAVDGAELSNRYDPDAMVRDQVYLGETYQDEGEHALEFLLERIDELRKFAAHGAATGMGAFAVIT